jgi:hypothetical protein
LPSGMVLDVVSGNISGSPLSYSVATNYTVKASDVVGGVWTPVSCVVMFWVDQGKSVNKK